MVQAPRRVRLEMSELWAVQQQPKKELQQVWLKESEERSRR